ncbi:MAG: prepilin-type N-terminal cleavage/methylation domain-containing protein, partial [Gemmatimonadota bacterium]
MRRRGGFTLVEVMVGLVITSVVALLVYGAIGTAADTQARLADGRTAVRGEMAWRALVAAAVRGIRSG